MPHRIDVHHHIAPLRYIAELAPRQSIAVPTREWTPARPIENMDKALKLVLVSQIVFGTDLPFRTGAEHFNGLSDYGFKISDLSAIERGNRLILLSRLRAKLPRTRSMLAAASPPVHSSQLASRRGSVRSLSLGQAACPSTMTSMVSIDCASPWPAALGLVLDRPRRKGSRRPPCATQQLRGMLWSRTL